MIHLLRRRPGIECTCIAVSAVLAAQAVLAVSVVLAVLAVLGSHIC